MTPLWCAAGEHSHAAPRFPGCDHAIPPDISWANFLHYREKLAAIA